ncbi:MAG TPA: alpha/beta hydrolase [Gemmatimonadales bacterium]|nr:alpha/beta hydrolase [Gemmatimonadales bacterium]
MPPALILVHGAVLNGGMWAPIAADLSRDYNVLTPDLPGHGKRVGEKFTLAAAIATVTDLAKQLAPTPIVLAGDSLGGYISLASGSALGDQLKGAVLGGCTGNFQGPVILALKAQMALTRLLSPESLKTRLEANIRREYPESAAAILADGITPGVFAVAVEELRKVDFRPVLASFKPPLLLLNGSKDWAHVLGEPRVRRANPRAEIRRLKGLGHGVSILRPALFAGILREFLEAHGLSGTIAPAAG